MEESEEEGEDKREMLLSEAESRMLFPSNEGKAVSRGDSKHGIWSEP